MLPQNNTNGAWPRSGEIDVSSQEAAIRNPADIRYRSPRAGAMAVAIPTLGLIMSPPPFIGAL